MESDRLSRFGKRDAARGDYVLYWCRAYRRAHDNLALDHAIARANALGLPVVAYEALDPRYPFASDRLHTFVLEGAVGARREFEARGIAYAFHLPRSRAEAKASRAVARLAARAALVVTDAWPGPAGSLWARTAAFAAKLPCPLEAVDDAVAVPLASIGAPGAGGARSIRSKVLSLRERALAPVEEISPRARRPHIDWPFEPVEVRLDQIRTLVASCEIDHDVAPVDRSPGGGHEAHARLERFANRTLRQYDAERNDMARVATSGLSPYLHFGHISAREVGLTVSESDAPPDAKEAFLEQLLVRRTLSFAHAESDPHHDRFETTPEWARATLAKHARDPRSACSYDDWMAARTPDPLWNAAQRELLRDGVIHPYARMLWGKVAMTLARDVRQAFAWLVELNDRYALDGRDPSGYENIAWCFGLHDRPFPERAVFGAVRSMTSRSAAAKWDVREYLSRVGASDDLSALEKKPRKAAARTYDEFDQRTRDDD